MNQTELEERTLQFSARVVSFCRQNQKEYILRPLLSQLIRSATSIGANYREANAACSLKDFRNKIFICKKETKETAYWLELISQSLANSDDLLVIKKECDELEKIFGKITVTLKSKLNEKCEMLNDK
jgi:four helix bundle protein